MIDKQKHREAQKRYRDKNKNKYYETTRIWIENNKEYFYEFKKKYRIMKWKITVEFLGDKCSNCGLKTKYISAYDIHHIDKTIKEMAFFRMGVKKFREYLEKYHDKLRLLCASCHRIEHHKELIVE